MKANGKLLIVVALLLAMSKVSIGANDEYQERTKSFNVNKGAGSMLI